MGKKAKKGVGGARGGGGGRPRHGHGVGAVSVAHTDDKKRAGLTIISPLLAHVPYEPLAPRDIALPKRQKANGSTEPDLPLRHIPEKF